MDVESSSINYLKLKEFLARNPAILPRTFSRWKKRGLIDFIQPGGANTAIFVPVDALERMEQRAAGSGQSIESTSEQKRQTEEPKPVRQPDWIKRIKPKRKEENAKEE